MIPAPQTSTKPSSNRTRKKRAGKRSAPSSPRKPAGLVPEGLAGSSFKSLPEVIDVEPAADLLVGDYSFNHEHIAPIVERVRELEPNISTEAPAYVRVEDRELGHEWHTDVGTKRHMQWCIASARVLLSHPREFTGGELVISHNNQNTHFHGWRDLVVWGPDLKHMVRRHKGERRVLLMFFARA